MYVPYFISIAMTCAHISIGEDRKSNIHCLKSATAADYFPAHVEKTFNSALDKNYRCKRLSKIS